MPPHGPAGAGASEAARDFAGAPGGGGSADGAGSAADEDVAPPTALRPRVSAADAYVSTDAAPWARRWVVVAASWLQHFAILGTLYSAGLYIRPMARAFGTGRGEAAWVGGMWTGFFILLSVPASLLPDRLGLKTVFLLGALSLGVGLAASAEAGELWVLYLLSALVGFGLAPVTNAAVMVQPWFTHTRGRATGMAMTGSGAGNFAYAIALQAVITHYDGEGCDGDGDGDNDGGGGGDDCNGWRWALRYQAAASAALCIVASAMSARPKSAAAESSVRKLRRLTMFSRKGASARGAVAPEDAAASADRPKHVSTMTLLGTPCARIMLVYWMAAGAGYLNAFAHFAAHAEDSGVSKGRAALLLSLMGLASVCGRVALGLAADRFTRHRVLSASCFVLAATVAVWPAVTSFGGLCAIALVYGFFAGAIPSLPPTIVADYYSPHFGRRTFVLYAATFVSQLPGTTAGPPICGFIFDETGEYYGAGAFSAVFLLVAGVVLLWMPTVEAHSRILDGLFDSAHSDDGGGGGGEGGSTAHGKALLSGGIVFNAEGVGGNSAAPAKGPRTSFV